MEWTTALPDWEARILSGQSLVPCQPLFPAEADEAWKTFRDLRMVDVLGSPTFGEVCRPWIKDFVRAVFGSYDAETGRRLIRYFLLLISKKNGKSTLAAGIGLTFLLRNWRSSAEALILAPTIEVAGNSFQPARDMIRADEELDALLQVQDHIRTITHRNSGATLKIVAADNETVSGKKASLVIIDELWGFGKRANAENMLREATGGLASRPEGMVISLTTQSDEPPAGVFKSTLDEFRDIRDGRVVDPRSMGLLYEFPKSMQESGAFRDPQNWHITNPNLGASVDLEFLLEQQAKAERIGEHSFRGFASKHLNVEIGVGLLTDRWAGADYWEAATERKIDLDMLISCSEVAVIGIDGGGLDDLLGLAVIGRDTQDGHWRVWTHAWAHPIVLERRKSEAPRLRDLAESGDLTIVARLGDDIDEVAYITDRLRESGLLPGKNAVGLDPVGIGQIVDELSARGITEAQIVGIPQGWKLTGAIKTAERKLADGTLKHAGQPLMAWCVGNARVEPKGNAITITKQLAGAGKIDPLMATFNAIALMSMNPAGQRSVYETRGLLTV